ncbi:MAG: uracil phosphoribosyltransferase [Opitutaceae bacterium]|jgi:uracil phosphoribosyltransferase
MPLHILDHPLASHFVTHLRDKTTKPAAFRSITYQLGLLLAIEATRDLPTVEKKIETPLEPLSSKVLSLPLVIVPIFRAGLGMMQPFLDLFPDVSVGYIGMERDHATAHAHSYYCKLPPLEGKRVIVVDPMVATGGSAVQTLSILKAAGADAPRLVCIVAAPEGMQEVERLHPDTIIHTAALDRALNDTKYILPGLGDFGDRLYGT